MEYKKDKNQKNDDIYSSLKGYFPERYDMTPDELEDDIEEKKKEREIALGMTDPRRTHTASPKSQKETTGIISFYEQKHTSKQHDEVTEAKETEPSEPEEDNIPELEEITAPESEEEIHTPESVTVPADEEPIITEDIGDISEEDIDNDEAIVHDTIVFVNDAPENEGWGQAIPVEDEFEGENELLAGQDTLDVLFDELEAGVPTDSPEKSDNTPSEAEKRKLKVIDWFFDFLEVFTVCMACIILFFSFGARLTMVDGESMEDTLLDGQYLVVSDLFYKPAAGDIVVLQNTSLEYELLREPLVKRIIAVGGETIRVSYDGKVTITDKYGNNKTLDQSFTKKEPYLRTESYCEVPEGYVFVMGDNRNNSTDSRDPRVGLVDERCIFGKAYMRLLPFDTFTVFENPYSEK